MSEQYCLHSMTVDDCLPCQKSDLARQRAHIDRLRQMLINVGAGEELAAHDAHWFGGNAQPLPTPAPAQHLLARTEFEPPVTISEPVQNDQGFFVGFRIFHPEGVECAYSPNTHQCSCGKMESDD